MTNSDEKLQIFSGGGTECEMFVQAVQRRAFAEGKPLDNGWIAGLVAMLLTGEALRWFARLDGEVQTNWSLLRQALLARFPAIPDSMPSSTTPLGRTLALPPYSAQTSAQGSANVRTGRILVNTEDGKLNGYVRRDVNSTGIFVVTKDVSEALQVTYQPSTQYHDISLLNAPGDLECLGIKWWLAGSPNMARASASVAALTGVVDGNWERKSLVTAYSGPTACTIWEISPNGSISAFWSSKSWRAKALLFAIQRTRHELYVVPDSESTWIGTFKYMKANLTFESL
ncbi:hypothetical protein FRB99_005711 [Tulasnella sp. 403]|nr:hypothetical protein FRB99_005711 [Tulasnella sp. 403]